MFSKSVLSVVATAAVLNSVSQIPPHIFCSGSGKFELMSDRYKFYELNEFKDLSVVQ